MDVVILVLRWVWVLSEVALILLLCSRKLWGRYAWFTGVLTVGLVQQVTLLPFNHRSWTYMKVWSVFELVRLAVLCGATLELTKRMLDQHRAIARIAVSGFGLIFALGICIGTGAIALFVPAQTSIPVHAQLAMHALRWVSFSTAGYLFGLAIWFAAFPIRMRRNIRLHRWLLALYGGLFPGWAVFMTNLVAENHLSRAVINVVMMAGCIICLWIWSAAFTQQGEQNPPNENSEAVERDGRPIWEALPPSTMVEQLQ